MMYVVMYNTDGQNASVVQQDYIVICLMDLAFRRGIPFCIVYLGLEVRVVIVGHEDAVFY